MIKINKDYLFDDMRINAMKLSKMNPVGFTIHNTGNKNISSAEDEAKNYYNNSYKRGDAAVIVNFTVDEEGAYQHTPINISGWHASDGLGEGNLRTVSIEIARDLDYNSDRYARAEMNTVKLIVYLHKEFGVPLKLMRHHDYDPYKQLCPHRMFEDKPNTWEQFKALVNAEVKGETVKPKPTPEEPEKPPVTHGMIFIHDFVQSWTVHKYGEQATDKNIVNSIKPSLFGGLSYEILETPYKDTITIKTSDYGKVNLYLGGVPKHWYAINTAEKPKPKPTPKPTKEYIQLDKSRTSWAVYPLGVALVSGNAKGSLNPNQFGGLEYEVLGRPMSNAITIQTRDFGKVNIYVGSDVSQWFKIVKK